MSEDSMSSKPDFEKLNENLAIIEGLSERLVAALASKKETDQGVQGPGQELYVKAAAAYMAEMMANPEKMISKQVDYWSQSLKHFAQAQSAMLKGGVVEDPETVKDRRFKNPMWAENPYFSFMRHQYELNATAIEESIGDVDALDPYTRRRTKFFARQIIDMMSPTNFLATNPDALEKALATNGQSLVDGLENFVKDIEAGDGDLAVTLSPPEAFQVGENIATTPGSVVFQNKLFQLIQYTPTTETVHKTPLVIFPPWINKYYVLDLKEKNSLIKWVVDQGYTLFVVSWGNPDETWADIGIEAYVKEGFLEAFRAVKAITAEKEVNAVGYCIAGTMLSAALAYLAKTGETPVKSATFFTTLVDFYDPGEMEVFLEPDFLSGIDNEIAKNGFLDAKFVQRTFSYLRANDLVYGPAIRSYMLGEQPTAFDLLHWNGDSTNLSSALATEYLHKLCEENQLMDGTFQLDGHTLKLGEIDVPICAIACQTDHIAEWHSSFRGLKTYGGEQTLILSQSGHIAGIVNPPSKKKYGHWTNDAPAETTQDWFDGAQFHEGSWWPRWQEWLSGRSGDQVKARVPGSKKSFPVIEAAPGSYVQKPRPKK
jgi:polyhydroxyalkanoate synthase